MSDSSHAEKADHLLKMIAIGLLKQEDATQSGQSQPVTLLNQHLRQGWEEYCYICFHQGELPPCTLPEFIRMLHKPVTEWFVAGNIYDTLGYNESLLSGGYTTSFCAHLGEPFLHSYNPRLELEDENFRRLHNACVEQGLTEEYTKSRAFIIRHPVLTDPIESISANPDWQVDVGKHLAACYEHIPPACIKIHNGKRYLVLCPHCGWALQWRGEEADCHADGICVAVSGDLSQSEQWIPYKSSMARTKEGVQRYVVAPEVALIALHDRLVKEWGLNCSLFPALDAYDLLIKFPNGKAWAVDVKDHRSAVRLAVNLTTFRYSPAWDRAFYVFPDYHADAAYLNEFGNYWSPEKDVFYCGVSSFIEQVREELNR